MSSAVLEPSPPPASREAPPRPAEIRGVVDNATADRLYGWAHNASQPGERVGIELRLGEQVVFRTVADFARPDLAKAGIGDGCHAFELPLTAELVERRAELSVVARAADGTEAPIALRIRRSPEATQFSLQRAVEALVAGQRQLREEVNQLTRRVPDAQSDAISGLLAAQQDLTERLDTLMLWLARLDERLAAVAPEGEPRPRRRLDAWQAALGLVLSLAVLAGVGAAVFVLGR